MRYLFFLLAVVVLAAGPARANMLDPNVKALAQLSVHGETCGIAIDDDKIAVYMAETFDDIAGALSGINTNIGLLRLAEPLDGIQKSVTCAGLTQFATENNLLAD